MVKLAVSNTKN